MSYADHFTGHLRLTLLRLLVEAPACRANSSILQTAADSMGISCTRDQLRTELAWLGEQRLVTTAEPAAGVVVVTLTERGSDVATGRAVVPGVPRPTPRG